MMKKLTKQTKYVAGEIDIVFTTGETSARVVTPIDEIVTDASGLRELAATLFRAAYDMEHGRAD
jgi:hypothetical protein